MSPTIRPSQQWLYHHRVGNVVQTAANKGVLLALVAMAQTFVVLTAGIDLSVGMIFILSNCVASYICRRFAADGDWRPDRRPRCRGSSAARSTG